MLLGNLSVEIDGTDVGSTLVLQSNLVRELRLCKVKGLWRVIVETEGGCPSVPNAITPQLKEHVTQPAKRSSLSSESLSNGRPI